MIWHSIGYCALCIICPVAWGLIVYGISSRIERRVLASRTSREDVLPLDYHI
jgi:hypothetical protein